MKELLPHLVDALAPVLVAITSLIFARLGMLISANVKSQRLRTIGLNLNETAQDVVLELEQNVVSKLRQQTQDGTIDPAEINELKRTAVDNLKTYLGKHGKADALKAFGFDSEEELEAVLRSKIEAEVAKIKLQVESKLAPIVNVSTGAQ